MRAAIGIPIIAFPSNWAKDSNDYIEKGAWLKPGRNGISLTVPPGLCELYEKYKDHPLITVVIAPHSTYTLDDEGLLKAKKTADGTLLS